MERVPDEPLRFLVGPTAAGKTALAIEVAAAAGAEILSLDSMLVYRGMDLGTAKPSPADRSRVAHHLIDLVEPPERYDLSRYLADFAAAEERVVRAGRRVLVVGGTGLYLQAVLQGIFAGPPHDPALRAELQAESRERGRSALHAELSGADPALAARLHENDEKRVLRGIEVFRQTGRRLSDWQREWKRGPGRAHRIVGLEVPPEDLARRISARTHAMLEAGWAQEALGIENAAGFGPTSRQALGYGEALALARGLLTREEAAERIGLATRRFARRQRTWFRRFPEICWLDARATPRVEEVLRGLAW